MGGEKGNVTLKSPLQGIRLAETYIPHSQLISVFSCLPLLSKRKLVCTYVMSSELEKNLDEGMGYIYRIVLIEYSN